MSSENNVIQEVLQIEDTEELPSSGHQTPIVDNGPEFGESVAKRFCESKRIQEADSNHSNVGERKRFVEPGQVLTYPHSMPASPTMFDARYYPLILRHKGPSHFPSSFKES